MNRKQQAVAAILAGKHREPQQASASAWAATNIALAKYWGKRDDELNLPLTDSLSVMLPNHGVQCSIKTTSASSNPTHPTSSGLTGGRSGNVITINNATLDPQLKAAQALGDYLNLFLDCNWELQLDFNIPVAAGFASSAACYAGMAKALNQLFQWELKKGELSALARLGSGSACRSIEPGFSHWQAGSDTLGTDSIAHALDHAWPDLCIGLWVVSGAAKPVSSREGMRRTRDTSVLYQTWPQQIEHDLPLLLQAIAEQDFELLGRTAEHNAMSMHATMASAWPPLVYSLADTHKKQQQIWDWRADGKAVYFTQDAGPNLKLLLQEKDAAWLQQQIPELQVIRPFKDKP